MDPSIMKLLEEDEDETMHSGADVEAFTAALNRDIEGGASTSQPSQSVTSAMSQDHNQMSSQMYSQWQHSSQDESSNSQIKQQDLRNQEQPEQQSSVMEVTEHGSSIEAQREVNGCQAPSGLPMQYKPVQVDSQGNQREQNSGEFTQASAPMQMQISGMGHAQVHESDRMLNPGSESQFSSMQRFTNQPAPVPEQAGNSANRGKQIPFGSLLPIILPELDKDRAMQLQTLYTKLRKNEIPKDGFVRHMRTLVGDQMLRLAVVKMQAKGNKNQEGGPSQFQVQSQNPMQQHHLRPPTGTATQFSDPYSFGQLHQKSQSTSVTDSLPSRNTPSVLQLQKDSGHQIVDNNVFKAKEVDHLADSHAKQPNQMSDRPGISIQGLSKQQQQHIHFPQSFPMYGASSYNPYTGSSVGTSSTMVKPQAHDPQMRQVHLHQGFGSARADGASQAMNAPKIEGQNSFNDPKRVIGTTIPNISPPMAHNSVPWQSMVSKEQKIGTLPPMGYVKQEPVEQVHEKQPKPQMFSSPGSTLSCVAQAEQAKAVPGNSNDELSERQHPGMPFPSSTRTTSMASSNSVSPHITSTVDTDVQVGPQSTSASPMSGSGVNAKASAKKPSSGQKKPLDAHTSSPPLPSKKQKVSGAFSDQSIEHLNDVTAVSGVNLREEEEQLFSGSKDDSRVSEASRKAVQEEEDRLILQKIPLQKKLAEIMTKCGLKNLNNDVERCLSLCVEERLRGLISSLIRVSKQRVDSEKSRHYTVVTSDVREQILAINQKAREEWDKKQAEAEKLLKHNEPESSTGVDGDKEKDEGRGKALKVNKEEDDKMRATAANVAARAAVGGDDMLSKWQLMAQKRQKRDGGPEIASSSQTGKDGNNKPSGTSAVNVRDVRGAGKKDQSAASAPGMRQFGKKQAAGAPPLVARCISIKDVIAVLEREPQMAKSTVVYRLYERMRAGDTQPAPAPAPAPAPE